MAGGSSAVRAESRLFAKQQLAKPTLRWAGWGGRPKGEPASVWRFL